MIPYITQAMCILLETVIILLCGRFLPTQAVFTSDGYIAHARRDCPGNDFIGGHKVGSFGECRGLCEVHAQCVGFVFRPYYSSGVNCWPKSVCGHLNYLSGGWATYKRNPGRGGCTFDRTPGFALYGHNDEILESTRVDVCEKSCLWDMDCLSFEYNSMNNMCFKSRDSKETAPSFFQKHYAMTYYQKRCGTDVVAVPAELLSARGGAFLWMKDGQCIKTFGPYGGGNGRQFSDEDMMFADITEIRVGHYRYIDSIAFKYGTVLRSHGGSGGRKVTTTLNPGELIIGIEGRAGRFIDKLLFITNQRTIGPFGSDGGGEFSVDGRGKHLLYISGGDGAYIDYLSFHFPC